MLLRGRNSKPPPLQLNPPTIARHADLGHRSWTDSLERPQVRFVRPGDGRQDPPRPLSLGSALLPASPWLPHTVGLPPITHIPSPAWHQLPSLGVHPAQGPRGRPSRFPLPTTPSGLREAQNAHYSARSHRRRLLSLVPGSAWAPPVSLCLCNGHKATRVYGPDSRSFQQTPGQFFALPLIFCMNSV